MALLEEKKEDVSIVEYLKEPPSREQLVEIVRMLGISPSQLIRKGEADFKDNFKGKDLSDDEWIEAMLQYPKLIERPIVIKGGKAALGRPPVQVLDIL